MKQIPKLWREGQKFASDGIVVWLIVAIVLCLTITGCAVFAEPVYPETAPGDLAPRGVLRLCYWPHEGISYLMYG